MSVSRRRFRIIKEIAEGGFGKVYLAEQISSDGFSRIVAIKLLHAKWSSHDEVVKRTRDEARVLGRIRHQHIVKVEDLTSIEGKCAIVMEYLEGVDLKWMSSFLKEKKLEFPRAALFEIILAVASALDAGYNGVPLQGDQPLKAIHRDIKPSNIFVTVAGGVKVLDFGTARADFAEREAKTLALAFGSQGYMAPERMLGEEDTPAADVFSLGITLYELLTLEGFGRIPPRPNKFQKKIDERVAAVSLNGDPVWCQQVRDTLRLMLSYLPGDRPSAAQLVEIMDLLAQDATDTGLRRYCRTLVSEAKDALPTIDTGDPLTGTIVDEDDSVAASGAGGESLPAPTTMSLAQTTLPPPTTDGMLRPAPSRASVPPSGGRSSLPPGGGAPVAVAVAPPPPAPNNVKTVNPKMIDPEGDSQPTVLASAAQIAGSAPMQRTSDGGPRSVAPTGASGGHRPVDPPAQPEPSVPPRVDAPDRTTDATSRRNVGLLGVVVFGVPMAAIVIGGIAAVLLVGAALLVATCHPDDGGRTDGNPPVAGVGGRILTPDSRTDKKTVPTILTFSDPGGADVEITGPGGFKAAWDGRAPFDLGAAGDGEYKSRVTPPNAPPLRLRKFTVDGTKASCTFAFELSSGEWTGGCR